MSKTYNILFSPLDWGLGHATRSIPIIRYITTMGCNVFIAAEGNIKSLLEEEFPSATFLPLKGYNIKYSKQKKWLPLKIITQIPHVLFLIYHEQQWLKKTIINYSIDGVISDNRFGFFTNKVPCVYITHQLFIKAGNTFIEKMISTMHRFFINKFTECWVPDFGGKNNIAGDLSHPAMWKKNAKYIGCLSRFHLINNVKTKYDLIILLSGPEPQRTILEDILLLQLKKLKLIVLLVRGLPGSNSKLSHQKFLNMEEGSTIEIKNHLNSNELNIAIQQAEMVICRSGYTTIMDLITLHKKAIFIPTPGQTEQEYLAKYLMERKLFYAESQNKFLLSDAIEQAKKFNFLFEDQIMNQFHNHVNEFLEMIQNKGK